MSRYEKYALLEELTPEAIEGEVERILASDKFARSKRLRSLLRFTVEQTIRGNADTLKEYVIGTEVLKKPDSYDPRSDSLVRVLASRLRVKLREYYSDGGSEDPLVIEFPKGKYVPQFQRRELVQSELEKKLRARSAWSLGRFVGAKFNQSSLAEAAVHFEEAIEADPEWPQPRIGMARVCALQGLLGFRRPREAWPMVKAQADSALQLDPMSAEGHVCLGMLHAFYEWRWRDADSHFMKAIERDAYSGPGYVWRALACLIPMGKLGAAQEAIAKAREFASAAFLDEVRLWSQYLSKQYDAVLKAPSLTPWQIWLRGCALAASGRSAEAIATLQGYNDDARIVSTLGYAYGISGRREQAREILARLHARRDQGLWTSYYDLALVHAGLGEPNEALALFHDALREREPAMAFVRVDPLLGSLRDTPKFAALSRRILLNDDEAMHSHAVGV